MRYVIRPEYLLLAIEKATPSQAEALRELLEPVRELNALDETFPERLRAARAANGVETPALSKAASEAASQSVDADREYHRLLRRRCGRAASAVDVVEELLRAASDEMDATSFVHEMIEDEPDRELSEELLEHRRRLIERLRTFTAE